MSNIKDGKIITRGEEAQDAFMEGAKAVYDGVVTTYGPRGRNVLIEKTIGFPVLTRDGVSVAKEIYFSDRAKNTGAQRVLEASEATNRNAGDGTSATVALTYNLLRSGSQSVKAGKHPMDVSAEIKQDSYKLLDKISKMSTEVKKGELVNVATVSAGDPNLGKLIAEAVEYVGPTGGLITEKAHIDEVEREYINGYYLQQGFTAITEGKKVLSNPAIVVVHKKVTSGVEAIELMSRVSEMEQINTQQGERLKVAFFGEIEGEAYMTIVDNIMKGLLDAIIVRTPPMGEMGIQMMDDLAMYTGGTAVAESDKIMELVDFVGHAEKVVATTYNTTVFGGQGSEEDIEIRAKQLSDRLDKEEDPNIAEKLKERLSKLEGKIALFRIGGATETEKEEKEFRIDDAIQATRAAYSHGIVPGGGVTLLALSKLDISEAYKQALQDTFKQLLINANLPAEVKLNEALEAPEGHGFNLRDGDKLVDVKKAGIVDPTLVVEQVVINATSAASTALTTEVIITFENKE